jgi:hypothetical protein
MLSGPATEKLPMDMLEKMRVCPISSVRTQALMMAPVYVHMKLNGRLVCVKRPFDFFNEDELKRLAPFQTFYFPPEVDEALRFRRVAHQVHEVLNWTPDLKVLRTRGDLLKRELVPLPPASYETSDAILRLLAPLWGEKPEIDPYYVVVFANELCDLIPGEKLVNLRDTSMVRYEHAVLISSWVVFLALHLGHCDLDFINRIRAEVFDQIGGFQTQKQTGIVAQLIRVAETEGLSPGLPIQPERLAKGAGVTGEKLRSRFKRIEKLAVEVPIV